ncbi:Enolase-phosphatase E1 [Quillaja saponaria]|uniref:Probable bifunctional methylthioribulose-1-phosphate dehydratase/enolase-phosphatase E1 n=1 Tax=Quillaja saponaria TaxID=32244 RepID=A0AAD7QHV3_QUISA|nr:Enolase-phosphatase E1 [Quillaja saponaria]
MAASVYVEGVRIVTTSQAYLEGKAVKETKVLISELGRQFYYLGWVSGAGGSIALRVHDDSIPKSQQLIIVSPSGVQMERMEPEDVFVLYPTGSILSSPSPKPCPHKPPKCSARCATEIFGLSAAGAVIHCHGVESCLVTMLNPLSTEFRITHMEMIKGIRGHGYFDDNEELVVPIIENTASENELTTPLAKAIKAYPKTTAVLVRNGGLYVWGDSWISAKTQAECYYYLFDAAIKLHQLGLDWSTPNHGPIQNVRGVVKTSRDVSTKAETADSKHKLQAFPHFIVLDIEGTTTPISFMAEVLFPYARDNVGKHLSSTYYTAETQCDIKLLRSQVQNELEIGVAGAVPIPSPDAGKEQVIAALVANVEAMIKADRKIHALKQLLEHIWKTGYKNNELEGLVFDDVPEALEKWHALGVKVYIYSSGSRLEQRLIFGNTNYGDLRKYLSGFFETTVGNKRETSSYIEILESLGVDKPSDVLFVTDVFHEATAAKAAGLEVIVSNRPGNGPLPEYHGFKTINSFLEI